MSSVRFVFISFLFSGHESCGLGITGDLPSAVSSDLSAQIPEMFVKHESQNSKNAM